MLKELSDDQLNHFKRGAPLLSEAYRQLRERMRRAEGVLSASTEALKLVKAEIEKVTKERDEARAQVAALREALRAVVKQCHCRGTGVYTRDCTLCGDSTYDHMCNDEERPCELPSCVAARAALATKRTKLAATKVDERG